MLNYTKDNHFKFGYNDKPWFEERTNQKQKFVMNVGQAGSNDNWRQSTILAAEQIACSTDLPIHILYSGGIDSEVAVLAFLETNESFSVDIMKFEHGLNDHDIRYAVEFCEQHDVPYKIHGLDILTFFEGKMYDYAALTHCVSPQLCATMWLVDQIEGFPIIGQGEPVLVRENNIWYFRESEKINSWYRFYMKRNREGVPGFHQYTPEQILSFLLDPTFLLKMDKNSGKTSNKSTKLEIYQKYFPLKAREKYTGFEMIMEQDKIHRKKLLELYSDWDDCCLIPYDTMLLKLGNG